MQEIRGEVLLGSSLVARCLNFNILMAVVTLKKRHHPTDNHIPNGRNLYPIKTLMFSLNVLRIFRQLHMIISYFNITCIISCVQGYLSFKTDGKSLFLTCGCFGYFFLFQVDISFFQYSPYFLSNHNSHVTPKVDPMWDCQISSTLVHYLKASTEAK